MPVHWDTCYGFLSYTAPQLLFASGAYGLYVPLFGAALWSSWQESTRGSKAMCAVSIVMFVVVTIQVGLTMYLGSIPCSTLDSYVYQISPLVYAIRSEILGASTMIAGLLSDGVLAWRCYNLYSRRRWMLWLMSAAVAAVGVSGIPMAVFPDGIRNAEYDLVWSPLYLAVNGALTVLVTARIFVLHRRTSFGTSRSILVTAGRTVVESALISWVGVFMMLLTDYYPYMLGTRKVVIYDGYKYHEEFGLSIVKFDVQPALAAALPTIFGISQTLIVTRVALTRFAKSPNYTATLNALTSDFVWDGSQLAV